MSLVPENPAMLLRALSARCHALATSREGKVSVSVGSTSIASQKFTARILCAYTLNMRSISGGFSTSILPTTSSCVRSSRLITRLLPPNHFAYSFAFATCPCCISAFTAWFRVEGLGNRVYGWMCRVRV